MELSQSALSIPSQLGKHAIPLPNNPNQVGQPAKRNRMLFQSYTSRLKNPYMFRNLAEKESTWQQKTCQNLREPIICVNS